MADSHSGGCLCGNIRYEARGSIDKIVQCHCKNCQKASGAGASANIVMKMDDLVFTQGEPKIYQDVANSGTQLNRAFCPDCGSSLYSQRHNMMDMCVLKAGSLDDSSAASVVMNIWTNSARPWVLTDEAVPAFEENRPV